MSRLTPQRLAWAVVQTMIAVLFVEIAVRVDDWVQFSIPLTARETGLADLLVRDSVGMHARPNGMYRQFRINTLGARGPEIDLRAMSGKPLLITTGASETFGLYEARDHEWPRQLEDSVRARCGPAARVLNAAFSGMSLPTVRQDVALRLQQLHPRVILYYPTPMQYLEAELPVAAPPSNSAPSPLPQWRSRALPRFRDPIKRMIPDVVLNYLRVSDARRTREALGATTQRRVDPERLDVFEQELRRLVGDIRARGALPVLVVHRNRFRDTSTVAEQRWLRAWERFYPLYSAQSIIEFDESAAGRTQRIAQDSGVLLVDPKSVLTGPADFADFSHFNDQGSARVGGAVAAALAPELCGAPRATPPDRH